MSLTWEDWTVALPEPFEAARLVFDQPIGTLPGWMNATELRPLLTATVRDSHGQDVPNGEVRKIAWDALREHRQQLVVSNDVLIPLLKYPDLDVRGRAFGFLRRPP